MQITNPEHLRSLINEAGRQTEFYALKNPTLSVIWWEIESIAYTAKTEGKSLILSVQDLRHPIIKAGE